MKDDEYREKGEVPYHFDKVKYYSNRTIKKEVPKKSRPFKDNKTLWIILLDIGVIFLFAGVILPLIRKPYEIKNFAGYKIELTSFTTDEGVFAVLDVLNGNRNDSPQQKGKFSIYIPKGGSRYTFDGNLPAPGRRISYTHSFKGENADRIYAKVEISGETAILRVKVKD